MERNLSAAFSAFIVLFQIIQGILSFEAGFGSCSGRGMPRVEIRPSLFFTFLIKQQDGMPMAVLCVEDLDHLVLTVADIKATCRFYQQVLGMTPFTFGNGAPPFRSATVRSIFMKWARGISLRPTILFRARRICASFPGRRPLKCWITSKPMVSLWKRGRCGAKAPSGPLPPCISVTLTET